MNLDKIDIPEQDAGIILTAFPGRTVNDEFSTKKMRLILDHLEDQRCNHFISLVEDHEFGQYCSKSVFQNEISKRPLKWLHLPIADMDIPDTNLMNDLDKLRPNFLTSLSSGNSIAIHCKGGLGRSGTLAAMILFDLGFKPQEAIEHVRSFRTGAIETQEQENFIRSLAKTMTD
jgi:protein-tyrosine phosphatase